MQHKDLRAGHCVLEISKLPSPCLCQLFTLPRWYATEIQPNKIPSGLACSKLMKGHRSSVPCPEETTARFIWASPVQEFALPQQQFHITLLGNTRARSPQNTHPNLTPSHQYLHQQPKQLSSAPDPHPYQEGVASWCGGSHLTLISPVFSCVHQHQKCRGNSTGEHFSYTYMQIFIERAIFFHWARKGSGATSCSSSS